MAKKTKEPAHRGRQTTSLETALNLESTKKISDVRALNPALAQVMEAKAAYEASLKKYVAITPDARLDPVWNITQRKCPGCEETKVVSTGFGLCLGRHGKLRPVSYCKTCRGSKPDGVYKSPKG